MRVSSAALGAVSRKKPFNLTISSLPVRRWDLATDLAQPAKWAMYVENEWGMRAPPEAVAYLQELAANAWQLLIELPDESWRLLTLPPEQQHDAIGVAKAAWIGDYLQYIVQSMLEHRTQAQPVLRTERGLIREVTAYGPGAVDRWRRFIRGRGRDDRIFGLWNRLVALAMKEIPDRAPAIVRELDANRSGRRTCDGRERAG